jgi:hypothetical protein
MEAMRMKNPSTIVATSALLCVAPVVLAQADAPDVVTAWQALRMSQAECMDGASAAFRAAGMTTKLEVVQESTRGEKGDYIGLLRCLERPKVVFVTVAGPNRQECEKLGKSLLDEFKKAKPSRR